MIKTGADLVDMASPVRGVGGVMYPLMDSRAEDIDIDFVLDIGEDELVVAPNVNGLSAGKGVAVILLAIIIAIDALLISYLPMLLEHGTRRILPLVMSLLTILLSVAVLINVFKAVRHANRLEPIVFSKVEGTVTYFGKSGPMTYEWKLLRPFIRIIQIVHAAGGSVNYQLVLAEVDQITGQVRSEFVAAKGDLVGSGVLRYGFFKSFMEQPLSCLPGFRLIPQRMDWTKRLAVSIWTFPSVRDRWTGVKSWTPLSRIFGTLSIILVMPLQMAELLAAQVTLGPYGERESGPWPRRFLALAPDSPLKGKARLYGEVTADSRRTIGVSLVLGALVWVALFGLFMVAAFG